MKLQERDYWLGFNIFPGIGPKRFYHLLKIFGSAKKAWLAKKDDLYKTSIPQKIITNFLTFRDKIDLSLEILRLEKCLIRFIIVEDKDYPILLKKISDPPPVLYIKGTILPQDSLAIGVVGTRQITSYGREVTEHLVRDLIACGFTIVSGLARGVDSLAHRLALGNGGRTIAVLGSGLDKIYPPEHKALAEEIVAENKGALVSQLSLGTQPLKGHFPSRNRIISGLSLGVLVTEGAHKSGAKITSEYALKEKRPVFAVPGPITSPMSEGPADLIKQGAKLVTKVDDILKEIKGNKVAKARPAPSGAGAVKINFNNVDEEKIWQTMVNGVRHIDEIIRQSNLSSAKTLSSLTTLELAGMVKNIGGGNYIIL